MKIRSFPREKVLESLRAWAASLRASHPEVEKAGLFGSYARGDHTPASDLDVLLIVRESRKPIPFRPLDFPPPPGPVGAEVFVYTRAEVDSMEREKSPWIRRVLAEVIWL